ncbi:TnsD family transposase [Funiculus sociatus GB2-C1]
MQYPDKQSVVKELFGNKRIVARVELPGHLNDLVTALPPGGYYTVDRLIENHTLLPFYSPFFPRELISLVREEMRGSNQQFSYGHLGLLAGHIQMFTYLRFCPLCVQEDKKQFGECYWHRLHQVSGVELCPTHQIAVINSGVLKRNRSSKYDFISAEQSISEIKPYPLELSGRDHENLLKISRDADWLLRQQNLSLSNDYLHNFYVKNLYERGLSTFQGRVLQDELLEAFKGHYSPTILKLLQCEFNEQSTNHWLLDLFRRKSRIRHPIRHLLIINFLGYTAEEVLKLPTKLKPFGDGPWLCLNRVCQHFKQPVIKECQLTPNHKKRSEPVGTFECICGFTYSQKSPDASAEDKLQKSRYTRIYGPLWELTLIRLWDDETISLNQIARQLGVRPITLQRQAALLELTFPRVGSEKSTQLTPNLLYYRSNSNPETKKLNLLEKHQKNFLEVRQQHPLLTRSKLIEICSYTYHWLQRNCPDWLETHLPPTVSKKGKKLPSSEVDWEKRDIELAAEVKAAVVHIRSNLASPIRVTVLQIGRDTGKYLPLKAQLDRLPLTAKVLAEMVETHEEFAVRKIEWAAKGFLEENICATQWQLLRRAKISPQSLHIIAAQQVKEAIDAALESLASIDAISDAEKSSVNDSRTLHEV